MILDKKYIIAILGIIAAFAIGLVFFFMFAEPYGDGLEKTMENADYEEEEQSYSAPLDYGDNYFAALIMGIVGFVIVLLCVLLYARFMRKKDETRDN
ncbi:MAG: hypothetical protein JSW00_09210 [Thermoplasmata archaeon]|nr:MAG: hypothetical protein JSW00_09210 [Thermoplasmata archaeon]